MGVCLQRVLGGGGVDWNRVVAGEAAETAVALPGSAEETIETEVADRVGADVAADRFQVPAVGEEALALAHIDSEVAGMGDRWGGDAEVDCRSAAAAEEIDDLRHGVTANDAVVDDDDALLFDRAAQRV